MSESIPKWRNSPRRKKRGISSVIGGIFVLAIIVLGITSIILITNMQDAFDQAQNSAAQLDTLKNQERLSLSNVQFGGSQTYSASQSYVTDSGLNAGDGCFNVVQICGLTMTSGSGFKYGNAWWCATPSVCNTGNANGGAYTLGTLEPGFTPFNVTSTSTRSPTLGTQQAISNANVTNSAAGWTFYTTSSQVIGGYDPIEGNGVPGSGVGSLFIGSTYVRSSTTNGNISTRFYVDPTATGTGTITSTLLSFAYFMPAANVAATCLVPTNAVDFSIYLVDQTTGFTDSGKNYLVTTITDNGDLNWQYLRGSTALSTLANGTAISNVLIDKGYYSLVIVTTINFKSASCTSAAARFYGYYDDIGLSYTYASLVSDWYYTFVVQQAPQSVQALTFSVTSFSNVTNVLQYVYIYDWVLNTWDQFSTSTASTTPTTVSLTVNVTNTGQFSAQNLVSSGGKVELRVYSIHPPLVTDIVNAELEV